MKTPENVTILMIYAESYDKKLAYVKCSCGRNFVMRRYRVHNTKFKICPCGGLNEIRQRLDRKVAMQFYKDKLNQYWKDNYDIKS